jgi:glycosyltransferase involved in cell wall biosynthesis
MTGLPYIVEVNSPLVLEAERYRGLRDGDLARRVESLVFNTADHILTVSEELADYVRSIVPHAAVTVLPNAVDLARFGGHTGSWRHRMGDANEVVVGFLGRVRPWHGVDSLIDALSLALPNDPRLRLCVVGNADGEAEALLTRAREHGISDRVNFLGEVRFEDVPGVLDSMDILVAPYPNGSDFYFSPLKLFEYMAASKPIVASRIGQVARVLSDGENAVLVPPGDARAISTALLRIAANPDFGAGLGANARALVETEHTWRHRIDVVLDIIQSIRDSKGAARVH